jgi:hypothetical protein
MIRWWAILNGASRNGRAPVVWTCGKPGSTGLFEAESRYNLNERIAADLLQMQPSGNIAINARLSYGF